MDAQVVHKTSFWVAIVAAGVVPLVPLAFAWFDPQPPLNVGDGALGAIWFTVDLLGGMGRGLKIGLTMAGIGAFALVMSLIAFITARYTGQPSQAQWMCGLPILLVILGALTAAALEK